MKYNDENEEKVVFSFVYTGAIMLFFTAYS